MKFKVDKTYKSIESLPKIELPPFTILTGLNGVGKSHFLEGINYKHIIAEDEQFGEAIKYVHYTNINFGNVDTVANPYQIAQQKQNIWDAYQLHITGTTDPARYHQFRTANGGREVHPLSPDQIKELTDIATKLRKGMKDLNQHEVFSYMPIKDTNSDIFSHNYASLFSRYNTYLQENLLNKMTNSPHLTDEDFYNHHGPKPWDFVNEVLIEAGLDYRVNNPEGKPFTYQFELKLVNTYSGAEINFTSLSSGEKVLMALALSLYNSKKDKPFPKLLLLDEFDAPLHGLMTKKFLDIIQKVFVKGKNVSVIIVSHSPSTVALSPEESIFVMKKEAPRLLKADKEKAIEELTQGLLTVTQATKYVFVEDKFDSKIYSETFKQLKAEGRITIHQSLVFIPVSTNEDAGGCNKVKQWTEKLNQDNVPNFWAIIDWDGKNTETDRIKVLNRYSIENYIVDPILVFALLLERGEPIIVEELEFPRRNFYLLEGLSDESLQNVADAVFKEFTRKYAVYSTTQNFTIEYVNGKKIQAPDWLRVHTDAKHGHKLAIAFREAFSKDKSKIFNSECDELIKMQEKLPGFISNDLMTIFNNIWKG